MMTNNQDNPKKPLWKRLLFSLLLVCGFLVVVSVILYILEQARLINTVGPESSIAYLEREYIQIIKTPKGDFYQINPPTTQTRFPVKKSENTFRIIVTGGSFARGDPYIFYNPYAGGPPKPPDPGAPPDAGGPPNRDQPQLPGGPQPPPSAASDEFTEPIPGKHHGEGHRPIGDPKPVFNAYFSTEPIKGQPSFSGIPIGDPEIESKVPPGFGGIPSWLNAILEMRFPSIHFEVISAGSPGANSLRVMKIVERLMSIEPDLVIVATGNNEGYVSKTPYNEVLYNWILYRALNRVVKFIFKPKPSDFYPGKQDPNNVLIEHQFHESIERIIEITGKHGVPLALATLPINLHYEGPNPRFLGEALPVPENDEHIESGMRLQKEKKYEQALEQFKKSSHVAFSAKAMGECYEAMGEYEKAKKHYMKYVQHNPLGRTRPSYNEFIRKTSRDNGLLLYDLEKKMETVAKNGIPGDVYFWDNCHLNWQGYRLMAYSIADSVIAKGLFPAKEGEPLPSPASDEIVERYSWQALYKFTPMKWWDTTQEKPVFEDPFRRD